MNRRLAPIDADFGKKGTRSGMLGLWLEVSYSSLDRP